MDQILVIDDDTELCELLSDYLGGEGFSLTSVNRGDDGAEQALAADYDLIILDVMLPGLNGFDVLRKIRTQSSTPVIMLTARGDDIDRIVGLELGADDYLPKPFNPRELIARIRAIQRRIGATSKGESAAMPVGDVEVGDVLLSPASRRVTQSGQEVELTSVEFSLLEALLRHVGEVVSREQLVEEVLGRRLSAYDRSIDVHISALRKKLGHQYGTTERIRTVRGIGYLYARPQEQS